MISHGSQHSNAATPFQDRSHQLGEGQLSTTGMSGVIHPPLLVYGSRHDCAVMPMEDRSHQLGEGQSINTGMSGVVHPSRSVYGSQSHGTAMSHLVRSHQLGKGQSIIAEMPFKVRPSRLVYGSQSRYAEMPCNQLLPPVRGGTPVDRSNARRGFPFHQFTGALVTTQQCLSMVAPTFSREVSREPQKCHAIRASQGKGHPFHAAMPNNALPSPPVLGHPRYAERPRPLRPILTRGRTSFAEMPRITRLSRGGAPEPRRNAL
jgi:hypothetical protein